MLGGQKVIATAMTTFEEWQLHNPANSAAYNTQLSSYFYSVLVQPH
jgi:hypothetical protein